MLHRYIFSTAIFMLTALLNLLTVWPLPLPRPSCTKFSTSSHPSSVHLPNARVNQYLHSFIPYTDKLWNSLPLSVFSPSYDLNSFKKGVSRPFTLNWIFPHVYISPTLLFTGSGDKWDFFFYLFLFSLGQYPFNVKNKNI